MPFIFITTADGTLVEKVDANEYDLTNPVARGAFTAGILGLVSTAARMEERDKGN